MNAGGAPLESPEEKVKSASAFGVTTYVSVLDGNKKDRPGGWPGPDGDGCAVKGKKKIQGEHESFYAETDFSSSEINATSRAIQPTSTTWASASPAQHRSADERIHPGDRWSRQNQIGVVINALDTPFIMFGGWAPRVAGGGIWLWRGATV